MKTETKRNWQALFVWIVLMVGTYFIHGFPDFLWFLGCAWVCLIISGILVLIFGKISVSIGNYKVAINAKQDQASGTSHGIEPNCRRSERINNLLKISTEILDACTVKRLAQAIKREHTSMEQIERLETLILEHKKLKDEVSELEAKYENDISKDELGEEKRKAQRVFNHYARKARKEQLTNRRREKIMKEREQIKEKLRDLGFTIK